MQQTTREPKSVLRPWVHGLTLQMQGTLVCALRGPDGVQKNDPAKKLVQALRATVLVNARKLGPQNSFAGDGSGTVSQDDLVAFFKSTDHYVYHWTAHLMHAAEVIGYMHPDTRIGTFWLSFYRQFVNDLHLNVETKEEMLHRLRADGEGE